MAALLDHNQSIRSAYIGWLAFLLTATPADRAAGVTIITHGFNGEAQ